MLPAPADRPIHGFDPNDLAVCADPFPTYRWLRASAPVYRVPGQPFWVLTRHADVQRALREHASFSSDLGAELPIMSLVVLDPPDHDRLRRVVSRAFTPRAIEALAPRVEEIAEELLAAAPERCDLTDAFADPLAMGTICHLLGIPAKRRRELKRWSRDALLAGVPSALLADPAAAQEHRQGMQNLLRYLSGIVARQRLEPRGDTIVGELLAAEAEGVLGRDELPYFYCLLFIGGHETTTHLIASGAAILASDPGLWRRLRDDPSRLDRFVEEVLRFRSPLQRIVRRTTREVEISGVTVPPESFVLSLLGAANRDPERFADPERFDADREPAGNLAFGHGIHYCLGAALARLEARVAFTVLLRRLAGLAHDPERVAVPLAQWGSGAVGWAELPVVLERPGGPPAPPPSA
jgi:cytochrome P450